MDPVAAAKEMEDLNAQMVDASSEYRGLRTPAALKKITDLNAKIQAILKANASKYNSIFEVLDTKIDLEKIEDNKKITQWALKIDDALILFEVQWFGPDSCDFHFKDMNSGYGKTNKGGELKVFAACKQILEWVVKERSPHQISFEADKTEIGVKNNRDKLYRRLLQRWTPVGYEFSEITDDYSANFFLRKKK